MPLVNSDRNRIVYVVVGVLQFARAVQFALLEHVRIVDAPSLQRVVAGWHVTAQSYCRHLR